MAYFENLEVGGNNPLQPHHVFGRLLSKVDTFINEPQVSRIHAVIDWQEQAWYLRDLSCNGTLLNGKKIKQDQSYLLKLGDLIQFSNAQHAGFLISDISVPCNLLIPLDNHGKPISDNAIELLPYHLLPNDSEPELAMFYSVERQSWCVEYSYVTGNSSPVIDELKHGDTLQCGVQQWQLFIIQQDNPTLKSHDSQDRLVDLEFIFDLSLDEEATHLQLSHSGVLMDLDVRSHHEVAMQLARYKAKDYRQGLAGNDQGWVYADRLATDLGIDVCHLNILIFRARKQLIQLMPELPEAHNLFERRKGRIRLRTSYFKVVKSEHLECALPQTG